MGDIDDTEVIIQKAHQVDLGFAGFQGLSHSLLYMPSLFLSLASPCWDLKAFEGAAPHPLLCFRYILNESNY